MPTQQKERRKEFSDVCRELAKQKPAGFVGLESTYGSDEGWEYHLHCAKEFAKRGWLSLAWPPEYGGKGDMMDRVLFADEFVHGLFFSEIRVLCLLLDSFLPFS